MGFLPKAAGAASGALKPDITSQPVESQATPLAGDLLEKLRAALAGGDPSAGVFGQQQQITGDINAFIEALSNPENFAALIAPIIQGTQRETQRGAAQVRETNAATGNRFSTSTEKNVGAFLGEREDALSSLISQLFLSQQSNLLGALNLGAGTANQNLRGMFDLAGQGILPEDTVVSDSPWMEFLKLGTQLLGAKVGAPPGASPGG